MHKTVSSKVKLENRKMQKLEKDHLGFYHLVKKDFM